MIKTKRKFYILVTALITGLLFGLIILLVLGDKVGQPLKASLTYQPEGPGGIPQIFLAFEDKNVPVREAVEAAFEITPPVPGDFSWSGSTLVFSPAVRLESDTSYKVRLRGGLQLNPAGRSAYEQSEWSFHTRPARIAYLKKEGQAVNLWITSNETGEQTRPLTFETNRQVLDFTVSPGGERIIYSLAEPDGLETSLWLVKTASLPGEQPRRLLQETGIRATAPRWSPSGDLIAYERRLLLGGGAFTQPQLWLIKPDGTSLAPLYGGSERYGTSLNWATGGSKAFFWEPKKQALGIFNFGDEPDWENQPGVIPQEFTVSPDGRTVILAQYDYHGAVQKQFLSSLTYQNETAPGTGVWQTKTLSISNQIDYNDYSPEWSPDGNLVAFLRENAKANTAQESRIWLYEPGSGRSWPLTPDLPTNTSLGSYQWSPDGQEILFERFPSYPKASKFESEIWSVARDGSAARHIVTKAFGAKWVN